MTSESRAREQYGIDAPTVVRALGIGGIALIVAGIIAARVKRLVPPSSGRFFMPVVDTSHEG